MLIHVDNTKFTAKPTGVEIGGIKARFTNPESIRDLTVKQIAGALASGRTIQPGVTPFSETSQAAGRKGTVKEDFTSQTIFMVDIDNKRADAPPETPAHAAETLAAHNLKAAFMYLTFGSSEANPRFRIAMVSSVAITDKSERDRVQAALIALFPQADSDCINADRIYFGTDKGLIEEFTDFSAVCDRAELLALAVPAQYCNQSNWSKYGSPIPTGQRHGTLVSFASSILKKYGITDHAYNIFLQRAAQCEEPKSDDELENIWRDACRYYEAIIATSPDYVPPDEYAVDSLEPTDYTDLGEARVFVDVYGGIARYSTATRWLVYDGRKWNESELKAQGLAQELTDRQLEEARKELKEAQAEEDAALNANNDEKAKEAQAAGETAKRYRAFVLGDRKSVV